MTDQPVIPTAVRRNHWMNQVAVHADMRPDATALRYLGQDTTWSQLHQRVTRCAAALARRGVGAGDRVFLLTLNSPQVIESVLAINTLGAIAVPVNVRLAPREIAYIIDDADGSVLVVDAPLATMLPAITALTERLERVVVLGDAGAVFPTQDAYGDLVAEDPGDFVAPDVPESTAALIMYTSGTTGTPKGAMLDHVNLFAQAVNCLTAFDGLGEGDVAFVTAPLFHIAGLGSIAPNLVVGVPTVIHPLGAFDATEILDAWEAERATVVFNVPTQWQAICAEPTAATRDLALRIISWGAAPASETLLRKMADTFPGALNVAVFGQTEMSPITCVLRGEDSLRKLGSVGKPIPTIRYRVVDDAMNDVAPGEAGEIIYLGPTLMQGYWRKPEATAEAFEGGWFHSGDVVRQDDDGFVWVVDRKKDMIISGGENIYCAEVENALFAHPEILDAAVYGRAHDNWGEVPVAAVVLAPGSTLDVETLGAWLDDRLARFKHPKALIPMDELPRNASGKVAKRALRENDPS